MTSRSSARQKGRKFQREVASAIKQVFSLEDSDVVSNPASCTGMDIILSIKAKKVFPFAVECKAQESLNIWSALKQAEDNAEGLTPMLIFKRNNSETYCCMRQLDLFEILKDYSRLKRLQEMEDGIQK